MARHHHLINGQWTHGPSYAPHINPSDLSDVIAEYAQGGARVACHMGSRRESFFKTAYALA